jgi:hypothetical protein
MGSSRPAKFKDLPIVSRSSWVQFRTADLDELNVSFYLLSDVESADAARRLGGEVSRH